MKLSYNEMLAACRTIAKENGLTFKRQNATINGQQAYKFVCRASGQNVISNCTLWGAYALAYNGDLESTVR